MGQGEKQSGEELVVLREVGTRVEADLIEALLRGAGIPCAVTPPPAHDGFWYGGWHGGTPHVLITIQVRASDLERAQAVIAERQG